MSLFQRFLGPRNPLDRPSPQTTAQYLCHLMEEHNALQRELIQALTGHPARTVKTGAPLVGTPRIRTDKDVFRVTSATIQEQRRKAEEQETAPWRTTTPANGPDSATTPPRPSGSAGAGPETA